MANIGIHQRRRIRKIKQALECCPDRIEKAIPQPLGDLAIKGFRIG